MSRIKNKNHTSSRYGKPRRQTVRKSPKILIVTEGEKSEPSYFENLVDELDLTNVEIVASKGTAPSNVVETAIREANGIKTYNEIYCVFDRDSNGRNYVEAIRILMRKSKTKEGSQFIAIPSIPCFEFWYLLHIQFSERSYGGSNSPCQELINELKRHKWFQDYEKASSDSFFSLIASRRDEAIANAKQILFANSQTGGQEFHENPSTRVHLVVERLTEIAE